MHEGIQSTMIVQQPIQSFLSGREGGGGFDFKIPGIASASFHKTSSGLCVEFLRSETERSANLANLASQRGLPMGLKIIGSPAARKREHPRVQRDTHSNFTGAILRFKRQPWTCKNPQQTLACPVKAVVIGQSSNESKVLW
ncbi:hypothetical protein NDN08_004559 [Rhodosorus marinus]|uniref:Uncharacterized protein n=1 Tax=Rhodosorus marinus TaxID=101924 RepID=A0AAV8UPM9_9RHOD|nr:hypothetical protein NDN08_004559 [Rhodosorus marinus]